MSPTGAPSAARPAGRHQGLALLAALLGLFVALLDVTVVTVALPTIRTDLNASFSDMEWVANAYLLALAVFIVTAGRLGDLFGQRRIYTAGVVVFLVGSLVCGGAGKIEVPGLTHVTVLHLGRVVQGFGGAVIMPLSLAIVYSASEGKRRALGMMLWGAVGGVATALGPLVGGLLVAHAGWEWIFLLNLPIGLVVIFAALRGLGGKPLSTANVRAPLDVPGLVSVSAMLFCLNLAIIQGSSWGWTSGGALGLFAAAAALVAVFLVLESRSAAPIMNLGWFRRPSFGGSVVGGFLLGAGMFSVIFYISIYLQTGLGLSAQAAGVRLLPMTLMLILGAPLGSRLKAGLGARKALVAALALMAAGIALLTLADPAGGTGSWTRLLPGMLLTGLTLGIAMPLCSELTIASAPRDQVGVAASAGTMFRQVGNAVGIAIMGALLSGKTDSVHAAVARRAESGPLLPGDVRRLQQAAVTHGFQNSAWYAAAATLLAAALVAVLVRDPVPAPGQRPADGEHSQAGPAVQPPATDRPIDRPTV
ncbi:MULTISPECIES: MFS transporter [Streptomyces]|uniref:MFS transporter n=1 Tax=Streptomyces TaxID=1883 RepID=UPI00163BFB2C|nr:MULTISPECIES: MFS transporter [Streptomyces]MBC2875756.1 MFS transporter [Streptomyces sp. TYQ1024]UBI37609.1 MFS transporter [Streptomyces mobaraensis]UKW30197.1 MFS transporter [Streptomyces sp. TYQ1024]